MKNVILAFLAVGTIAMSCNSDTKKPEEKTTIQAPVKECVYNLNGKPIVNWTAFKTTDKVAVNGQFNQINLITNTHSASSIEELISDAAFTIKTTSVDSKNEIRDAKLVESFFKIMKGSGDIGGNTGIASNGKIEVKISLNDVKKMIPFSYSLEGNDLTLNGMIDLNDFQAQDALNSLNEACKDLHKGADGISKTWPQVEVNMQVKIAKENCD